ncbi:hypothetical protein NP493_219g00021 [Ridgeia piscesae]|uniref:Protein unc-45 homolog B n=1 Tax=Ridgeia piscesae TaxID=27915 RepID=A0AAD9UE04_RIDPI|nr:hypothetical protein NP493_219g00021 [Ridgeia piscesae]
MDEAKQIKEQGNAMFKAGKYEEALTCYTKALNLDTSGVGERNVYLKNRAACYLKLEKYLHAVNDCTTVLESTPGDPKALFRRCQAQEQLGSYEAAYKDAMLLMRVDPKNTAVQPILRRLSPIIQDKVQKMNSTESKVTQMFDLAFDASTEEEKRKQAATNLIVLAREEAGAAQIFENDGIQRLQKLMQEKNHDLKLTAIRVLACLAQNCKKRANAILDTLSLKIICIYIGNEMEDVSTAMAHVLRNIINSVTDLEKWKAEREKHDEARKDVSCKLRPYPFLSEKMDPESNKLMDYIFPALITMLGHHKVSGFGRDNVMEIILKFVTRKDGCGWAKYFIDGGGIQGLLEVAGTIPEHKTLPITTNTRMHTSLCLSKIWDDLMNDKERDLYREAVNGYFTDMFGDNMMESKLEAIMALTALLQGPLEVGNVILAREGVLEILLAMADSGDIIHTKYAVEALVHSASKKNRCSGVIKQATPILKELYQSQNDAIKVRALVGLCKLGSFGGGDASAKSFADGSTRTLAKACRKFLSNASKDVDLRKWAAEGLAYLTLDAEVKQDLVEDNNAINSLIDLAKIPDKGILYPVAQILVNCTNSFDKVDVEEELIELAKFSKQHVPEEHEKDKEPYISERVKKLLRTGVVNALVVLSKTESESSRELLARVYLSLVMDAEHRGLIVQQGGAKALIPLANSGTPVGKAIAAQALAKIAITQNPEIAFPGQRACEVVRPILQLLAIEKTALQNFEALMALTNLASMNDTIRSRIVKEGGTAMIEHYLYEEHDQLRRASMECMCNLVQNEKVAKSFEGENDRVKLVVLFSGEDDEPLVRAAAGCLAILSSERAICHKITTSTTQWFTVLQQLAVCEVADIQHRGVYILLNMINADKELAARIIESDMLEVLMALSKLEGPEFAATQKCANEALTKAVEWELIKSVKNPTLSRERRSQPAPVTETIAEETSTAEPSDGKTTTPADNATPQKVTPPAENATPLAENVIPPAENATPPAEKVTPPAENATPLAENVIPPAENATPPAEKVTPPAENATQPAEKTTPSAENVTPPAENSTAPAENAAPDTPAENTAQDNQVLSS